MSQYPSKFKALCDNMLVCNHETDVSPIFKLKNQPLDSPAWLIMQHYLQNIPYFTHVNYYSTTNTYYYSVFCLTTGPKPLPKLSLHMVRFKASSFKWEYPLLSLRSSSSWCMFSLSSTTVSWRKFGCRVQWNVTKNKICQDRAFGTVAGCGLLSLSCSCTGRRFCSLKRQDQPWGPPRLLFHGH